MSFDLRPDLIPVLYIGTAMFSKLTHVDVIAVDALFSFVPVIKSGRVILHNL